MSRAALHASPQHRHARGAWAACVDRVVVGGHALTLEWLLNGSLRNANGSLRGALC